MLSLTAALCTALFLLQDEEPSSSRPANEKKSSQLRAAYARLEEVPNPFFGTRQLRDFRAQWSALPKDAPFEQMLPLLANLSDFALRAGQIDEALQVLQSAWPRIKQSAPAQTRNMAAKLIGMAYLRRAERVNCLCARSGESCLFPIQGGGVHRDRAPATEARKWLLEALDADPKDLHGLWLLNLVVMTLDEFPEGVPERWRLPADRFGNEADIGRYFDVAPKLGLNTFSLAGGSIMDDFNGDERLDIMVSSMDPAVPLRLFHNAGDGTFSEVSEASGVAGNVGGFNLVQADIDNDGRLDVLVLRGAWLDRAGELPNSLLRQMKDGTFIDFTRQAGILAAAPTQVGAFDDIDLDGDLDLFLGYESVVENGQVRYPSRLFQNRGDGRFDDVTARAGVSNDRFCKGASFGDFDGDRDPDLFVANMSGGNRLYRNEGDGTFKDVAPELGLTAPSACFNSWFWDYDQDGDLDLWVSFYGLVPRCEQVSAYYKDGTRPPETCKLYENNGKGGFRDVTKERGMDRVFFPMGGNFGDLDEDGFPDVYLGTGDPTFSSLWPNVALRNDAGRRFQDVTTTGGFGHLQKGHGVSFGDLDDDGDQDVFIKMGGVYTDDPFWDLLFLNPGHGCHWLNVKLVGTRTNRSAIGAHARVIVEEEDKSQRTIHQWVNSGGSFGANSLQLEFGLGRGRRIVALEVTWPVTGAVERFEDVSCDASIRIVEGEGKLTGDKGESR